MTEADPGRPRVYLAGPDVFLPNAAEVAAAKQAVCGKLGLDGVHPFDLSDTASALARALGRDPAERAAMASRRREVVAARTAHDWLDDQLAAISR